MHTFQSSALLVLMKRRCVHCLNVLDKPTKDHVFPREWYPENTPQNVQRWTAPCCNDCNGKFGTLEKKLFTRLALCIDPSKAEASGISKKVMEDLGVGVVGIKDNEKSHRQAQLDGLLKETARYEEGMDAFPGFGPHEGFPENEQKGLLIAEELLVPVAKKILRGCEYKLGEGRYIEAPYRLEVSFPNEDSEEMEKIKGIFQRIKSTCLGPGFRVQRAILETDAKSVMYRVAVWDTLMIYGAVVSLEWKAQHGYSAVE